VHIEVFIYALCAEDLINGERAFYDLLQSLRALDARKKQQQQQHQQQQQSASHSSSSSSSPASSLSSLSASSSHSSLIHQSDDEQSLEAGSSQFAHFPSSSHASCLMGDADFEAGAPQCHSSASTVADSHDESHQPADFDSEEKHH
jgi:hypothetical protein